MKEIAVLGAAALIAAAGVLWFTTKPALVRCTRLSLSPSLRRAA
jgi:hypothetical protein